MYFTDTGTLCYLAGLRDAEHATAGPMGGAIMETAVLSEILKTVVHEGRRPQFSWTTSAGPEVDFVRQWDEWFPMNGRAIYRWLKWEGR